MAKNSCQKKPKFSEILGTKVVQFWCYTKLVKTKNVPLNGYSSAKFFLESFGWFLKLKIDFENQILAFFDGYFWPFNNSHEKIKSIFVINTIIPSIWNVFIKFRWHYLGLAHLICFLACLIWAENWVCSACCSAPNLFKPVQQSRQ